MGHVSLPAMLRADMDPKLATRRHSAPAYFSQIIPPSNPSSFSLGDISVGH